jgi:hypothetical protein
MIFVLLAGLLSVTAALCAAPFTLDIRGGKTLFLRVRYLWLTKNINAELRRFLNSPDMFRTLRLYAPVFRKPLRLRRFRLDLAFSTGDAAETAALHGWLNVFFVSLYPLLVWGKPAVSLNPFFSSRPELSVNCDISLGMPAAALLFRVIPPAFHKKRKSHV